MNDQNIHLLLAQMGSTLEEPASPALPEGLPLEEVRLALEQPHAAVEGFPDPGGNPNSLPEQRWGIVAPAGPEGDRLLALIEPLRRRREEQQGHPVQVYRVPESLKPDPTGKTEPFSLWKTQVLDKGSLLDRPLYLLFLGDLHQVPIELQQYVATDSLAGRLAFRREQDYEAYVDKVLRWERKPYAEDKARTLFYTVHDGSSATTIGYHALMAPTRKAADEDLALGNFPASEVVEVGSEQDYDVDRLLEEAARPEPTVLFSMSHGLGAPRAGWSSVSEQLALQGAMNLGHGERLEAADLVNRPFLPGGAWFYFACLGAGTPSRSAFYHWLKKLKDVGKFGGRLESVLNSLPRENERPFISALPQAALANPQGPLAVYGHIDLAWTFGIQNRHTGRGEVQRFLDPLYQLVKGRRAGLSLKYLLSGYHSANTDLTVLLDEESAAQAAGRPFQADPGRMAHLWMVRQDLVAYVLLGDPAVRVPLATQAALARPTPTASSAVGVPGLTPRRSTPSLTSRLPEPFSEPGPSGTAPVAAKASDPVAPDALAKGPSLVAPAAAPVAPPVESPAAVEPVAEAAAALEQGLLSAMEGALAKAQQPRSRHRHEAPPPEQAVEEAAREEESITWSEAHSIDAMEQVVLRLAALRQRLARELGMSLSDILYWEKLYHEAGRAALAQGVRG